MNGILAFLSGAVPTDIEFTVFGASSADDGLSQLAGSLSLDEINKWQGNSGRPLELFYKFVVGSSSDV
jgi:hypothetical protein